MHIKWTNKKILMSGVLIASAVGIGLNSTIARFVDPTIPINKLTNTIGILLLLTWLGLIFMMGWIEGRKTNDK